MNKESGEITVEARDGQTLTFDFEIRELSDGEKFSEARKIALQMSENVSAVNDQSAKILLKALNLIASISQECQHRIPLAVREQIADLAESLDQLAEAQQKLSNTDAQHMLALARLSGKADSEAYTNLEQVCKSTTDPLTRYQEGEISFDEALWNVL